MCNIIPFNYTCCDRFYVEVTRTKDCPPHWPEIKCPKQLVFQVGPYPPEQREGICWRCKATLEGLSDEQKEAKRPILDFALIERFIDTPEMKRQHQEAQGFCWFCGSRNGCPTCEKYIDPDMEEKLGRSNIWDDNEDFLDEQEEEFGKRANKGENAKGKGRARKTHKSDDAPSRTRAKTRSQAKAGQSSKLKSAGRTETVYDAFVGPSSAAQLSQGAPYNYGSSEQHAAYNPAYAPQFSHDNQKYGGYPAASNSETFYHDPAYMTPPIESHSQFVGAYDHHDEDYNFAPSSPNTLASQIDPALLATSDLSLSITPGAEPTSTWTSINESQSFTGDSSSSNPLQAPIYSSPCEATQEMQPDFKHFSNTLTLDQHTMNSRKRRRLSDTPLLSPKMIRKSHS